MTPPCSGTSERMHTHDICMSILSRLPGASECTRSDAIACTVAIRTRFVRRPARFDDNGVDSDVDEGEYERVESDWIASQNEDIDADLRSWFEGLEWYNPPIPPRFTLSLRNAYSRHTAEWISYRYTPPSLIADLLPCWLSIVDCFLLLQVRWERI